MYNAGVSTEPVSDDSSNRARLGRGTSLALIAAAFVVRGGVLWWAADFSGRDADAYRQLAAELWDAGQYALDGRPTALRPPLYPLLLTPLNALGEWTNQGIGWLHLTLGVAAVVGTWCVARSMGLNRGAALAALTVALDPILLNQSRLVMSETAAACCASFGLWSLAEFWRRRTAPAALAGGVALGLACVCRPEFFPWMMLAAATVFIMSEGHMARHRAIKHAAIILFVAAIPVALWAARNVVALGRPILLTSHGGYTMYLANNDRLYDYWRKGDTRLPWDSAEFDREVAVEMRRRGESFVESDAWCYAAAWDTIRRRPGDFLHATWRRAARFWSPLPYPRSLEEPGGQRGMRYGIAVWYVGQYAAALLGMWKLGRRAISPPWVWGLLLVLCFAGIHSIYWSDMRMRSAVIPVLALWVGAAWETQSPPPRRVSA